MRAWIPVLLGLPLLAAAQPEPDWRFVPPQTSLIAGVDVRNLLESPLVRNLLAQLASKNPFGPALLAATAMGQVPTRVILAMQDSAGDPQGLLLIQGSMDERALASGMTPGTARADVQVRRLDGNTLLAGPRLSVDAALRRLQMPASGAANPLIAQARTLATQHDVWFAGSVPKSVPGAATDVLPAGMPPVAALAAAVRDISLGIRLRDQVRVDFEFNAANPEAAEGMLGMIRQSSGQLPVGTGFEASAQGARLHMSVAVPSSVVEQALMQRLSGDAAPAGNGTAVAPVPQRSNKIMIYGLEDGPKEVGAPKASHP
jgi:hypothetical protein